MIRPMSAAAVRPRPLDLGELFDELFRVYRSHFVLLAGVSLLVEVPGIVWSVMFGARFVGLANVTQPLTPQQAQSMFGDPAFIGGILVLAVVSLVLAPFFYGSVLQAAADAVQGRNPSYGSVLASVAGRYFPIWGWILTYGVVLTLIAITCVGIPVAIWLSVAWSLSAPVLFIERQGPLQAISRSWQLIRNAWWRTFGVLLLALLLATIIGGALGLVAQIAGFAVPGPRERLVVTTVVASILRCLVNPIVPIFLMLLYIDRRVRAEALELDVMARAASQSGPGYGGQPATWQQQPGAYPPPGTYSPPPPANYPQPPPPPGNYPPPGTYSPPPPGNSPPPPSAPPEGQQPS
jgi:hypothetical protein